MLRGQRRRRVQRRARRTQGWRWIQGSGSWRRRIQGGKGWRGFQRRERGLKISSILSSRVSAFTLHLLISIFFSTPRSNMERRTNKKKLSRNLLDMKVSV